MNEADVLDPAFRVWVVDDVAADGDQIADSFRKLGAIASADSDLMDIGDRVDDIREGEVAPDVIVIDQHWKVRLTNLGPLGRKDIKIDTHQSVGAALGVYFRSHDELDRTILLMTSGNEDELKISPAGFAPSVSASKSRIKQLPKLAGPDGTMSDALAILGLDPEAFGRYERAEKWLKYAANIFGLTPLDAARLGGARVGIVNSEEALRDFVWTSRDASDRTKEIQTIVALLRQSYGRGLFPPLEQIEIDFKLSIKSVLLTGQFGELIRLREMLEAKGGGPLA